MSDKNHSWKIGSALPLIRPHSLAKHRVIQQYLLRYVETLTSNPRIDQLRLTLVDGFAGGGMYRDELTKEDRFGSPLLMLQAMQEAQAQARKSRTKEFKLDVEYFFIEKAPEAFEHLKSTLNDSAYKSVVAKKAELLNDSFTNQIARIVKHIKEQSKKRRAIFVLDQFGYIDVPMPQIRHILSELENAEIILTFATDSLIDYLSSNEITQRILEKLDIPIGSDKILTLKQQHDWRLAIQALLHKKIHEQSNAKYYTPFFIRSPDAHRDFWLIHLSGHAKARDVMVGLHWTENTSFAHYGRSGLQMLGYDPGEDFRLTRQAALPMFCFDDTARSSTQESLMNELPERLHGYGKQGGIPFFELFASLTNESPATSDIFQSVVSNLAKEGMIEIINYRTGRGKEGIPNNLDIIKPSKQRRMFLP